MPASTFTSRAALSLLLVLLASPVSLARADDTNGAPPTGAPPSSSAPKDITNKPEEEDYSQTPYTEYGSFNEDKEEEEDTRFFQYGRFFGLSIGAGLMTADGNRGTLYQGGFPTFDAKVHYWFDFNFALDINFIYSQMYFITDNTSPVYPAGRYDANIIRLGLDLKYYFDTKNLSAAISFANPYVLVGIGSFTKTISADQGQGTATSSETSVGFDGGVGLEFALKPRKVYLTTEARIHMVSFPDNNTAAFKNQGIGDLHGNFYTFVMGILFTW